MLAYTICFEVLNMMVRFNGVILGRECIKGAETEEQYGTGAPMDARQV